MDQIEDILQIALKVATRKYALGVESTREEIILQSIHTLSEIWNYIGPDAHGSYVAKQRDLKQIKRDILEVLAESGTSAKIAKRCIRTTLTFYEVPFKHPLYELLALFDRNDVLRQIEDLRQQQEHIQDEIDLLRGLL